MAVLFPYWKTFEPRIDHAGELLKALATTAEPTTNIQHFHYIAGLWAPHIQNCFLAGNIAVSYVLLYSFYVFVRVHKQFGPDFAEAVLDQVRAFDFVMDFMGSNIEAKRRFDAEYSFCESTRYMKTLLLLATHPDQFTREDAAALFTPMKPEDMRQTWATRPPPVRKAS